MRCYEMPHGDAEVYLTDAEEHEREVAPWGRCVECGEPAEPNAGGACNDCRGDGWFRCEECGETFPRSHALGSGRAGYVRTVEDGRSVYRDHRCAREHFNLTARLRVRPVAV